MLSRQRASDAVSGLGWRYLLGAARTCISVGSLVQASEVAARILAAVAAEAGSGLQADLHADRVIVTVRSPTAALLTVREVTLAQRISAVVDGLGLATTAGPGAADAAGMQLLEIAIDALDIAAVRPFWKAVLGYADEPWAPASGDGLVDSAALGPAIWFQQMDYPRPQRNRIHLDIAVPHDQAQARIRAALAAGGRLLSDEEAPAFWVLADAEGNEACITTWQGRDQPPADEDAGQERS